MAIATQNKADESEAFPWSIIVRFATTALFFDALGPLLPQIAASFALDGNAFQVILGASYIAFAVFQLLSVSVIASIGLYRSILVSSLYVWVATVFMGLAGNVWILGAAFISLFAVNSIGSNATRVALRDAASDVRFKRWFAWATAVVQVKQTAMPLVASVIAGLYGGWQWAAVILAAPVAAAGVWAGFADRGRRVVRSRQDQRLSLKACFALLRTPAFFLPVSAAAAFQLAFGPLSGRFPFILAAAFPASPGFAGLMISLSSAVMGVGFGVSGWLASRLTNARLVACGVGVLIPGLAFLTLGALGRIEAAIAGFLLVDFAYGFIMTPCTAAAMNVPAERRPLASGLFGFIIPLVNGAAVLLTGAAGLPHLSGGVALLGASILALLALTLRMAFMEGKAARVVADG